MHSFFSASAIVLLLAFCSTISYGQQPVAKYESSRFKKEPIWIQMMNDPQANYFETIKAFREFWKGYKLPGEPEALERADNFEKAVGLEESKDGREKEREKETRIRKDKNFGDYSFEVKQFKGWFRDSGAWVQPDGHILTLEERQKLIDAQQNQLKQIEKDQKH